jgi:hypothetical protein
MLRELEILVSGRIQFGWFNQHRADIAPPKVISPRAAVLLKMNQNALLRLIKKYGLKS